MKQKCLWLVCRNNTLNRILDTAKILTQLSLRELSQHIGDGYVSCLTVCHQLSLPICLRPAHPQMTQSPELVHRFSVESHTCQYWPGIKSQPVALPVFTPFLSSRLKS